MKIIEYLPTAQNVTHLPSEVLDIIIEFVQLNRSRRIAQKDLWSCCLVGQEWYPVAIKSLYRAPVLLPRNFPEFARTLSPSLSSRVRRIGLEDLVEYLDMGLIAYESQKSTTSRLLSRTKSSLKSFVAPAVSFSTTSLAPLSKCSHLQRLDLSRDQYDFGLLKLLRSIKDLNHLEWLSLPKDCPSGTDNLEQLNSLSWPRNLNFIQFNTSKTGALGSSGWSIVAQLPPRVFSLVFNNCVSYGFIYDLIEILQSHPAHQITRLCLRINRCDSFFSFNPLIKAFPKVVKLTVPAMTQWLFKDFVFSDNGGSWSLTTTNSSIVVAEHLEVLILEESPDFPFSDHIRMSDLNRFVENSPRLVRIEVPYAYLDTNDFMGAGTNDMNGILSQRFKEIESLESQLTVEDAGIFITEPKENAGVGLKRSFQYHSRNELN